MDLTSDKQFRDQKLTTFAEFLGIAKHAGKSVLFDLWQPPPTHPHFSGYINVTLEAIISSGINQSKVGHKFLVITLTLTFLQCTMFSLLYVAIRTGG